MGTVGGGVTWESRRSMQEDSVSAKEMGKLEKFVFLDCQSVWQ